MTENERRVKAQMDANTAAIARMNMQQQHRQAQQTPPAYDGYDAGAYEPPPQYAPDGYGDQVDPNQLILQAITTQAAKQAASAVAQTTAMASATEKNITAQMQKLVVEFPALAEEGSELVIKSRQIYTRVASENPGLPVHTLYNLAVREAATAIGARPANTPPEDMDWTMGTRHNPALASKTSRSRLTPQIIANAQLMGIDVDPKTKNGQKNLKELSEYSARFNADVNEEHVKYR